MQCGDALQIRTGNGRHARDGTGGNDEFVIRQRAGFSCDQLFEANGMILGVNARHFRVHLSVNVLGIEVEYRVSDNTRRCAQKLVAVVKKTADIIRVTAGRHGQIRLFLQNDNFRIIVDSPGFRRRFGAGSRSSDHDDFFSLCH